MSSSTTKGIISLYVMLTTFLTASPVLGLSTYFRPHDVISIDGPKELAIADINNDGLDDIVVASYNSNSVLWCENLGNFTFTVHSIANDFDGAFSVAVADIDFDNDMDVLGGAYLADEIRWWENDGTGLNWEEHIVSNSVDGVQCVRFALIHGFNGDLDIVAAAYDGNYVRWWQNDGDQNFTQHEIPHTIGGACCVADIPGSEGPPGYLIVSAATDNEMIGLYNDGWGNFTYGIIRTDYAEPRSVTVMGIHSDHMPLSTSHGLGLVSIGVDTDLELPGAFGAIQGFGHWRNIIATSSTENKVVFFEYSQDDHEQHIIDSSLEGASWVCRGDMNNDGQEDIIADGYDANLIRIYENQGSVITIVPVNWNIPPGGYLVYDLNIDCSSLDEPINAFLWAETTLPDGNLYGPVFSIQMLFAPGMIINATNIHQYIPPYAPLGYYNWKVGIGLNPCTGFFVYDSFSFPVWETLEEQRGNEAMEWTSDAPEKILAAASNDEEPVAVTDEYTLSPANPNPFNASTRLAVYLPESTELRVTVYNVAGQQVAEVANGQLAAGQHNLTFNAQGLASGLYFIHAIVPGQLNQTQKVMLVR